MRENERKLAFLRQKHSRIDLKRKALDKYQNYLDTITTQYKDEFPEVQDIVARYQTLTKENKKLEDNQYVLETKLNEVRDNNNKYIKEMETAK
jgi:hypothetical protein